MSALVTAKPWWQSKTIILGAIEVLSGGLELVAVEVIGDGGGWALVAAGTMKILMRLITERPVATTEKKKVVEDG